MTSIRIDVTCPATAAIARESIGPIANSLSIAHACALRRALEAEVESDREREMATAQNIIAAQIHLCALELFITKQMNAAKAPRR